MFIYNTTFVVNSKKIHQWKKWLTEAYFPAINGLMVTISMEIFEVMTVSDDTSKTYSVQWRCITADDVDAIKETSLEALGTLPSVFGEDCLHFSSILRQFVTE
jgi:hypothetical protein